MRRNKENSDQLERAISAPAIIQRARSAGPARLPKRDNNPQKLQLNRNTDKDSGPGTYLKTKLSAWEKKDGSRPSSILKR